MVKINLFFTTSKFAAYLILGIGTVFAFVFHDSGTLLATFSATSAILMLKTFTNSKIEGKKIDKNTNELSNNEG